MKDANHDLQAARLKASEHATIDNHADRLLGHELMLIYLPTTNT
jgi:hypothetical protein